MQKALHASVPGGGLEACPLPLPRTFWISDLLGSFLSLLLAAEGAKHLVICARHWEVSHTDSISPSLAAGSNA